MKQTRFRENLRREMVDASSGYCQCCYECVEKVTEFHHVIPNTQVNQTLYPLFLQSPFNMLPINNNCHMTKPLPQKPPRRIIEMYEKYLKGLVNVGNNDMDS